MRIARVAVLGLGLTFFAGDDAQSVQTLCVKCNDTLGGTAFCYYIDRSGASTCWDTASQCVTSGTCTIN